jgi:DNA polymerase III delta prime subunit
MKVSDIKNSPPHILLYGRPGTGKTLLSLTLGEHAQVIDMDGGLRSGVTHKDKFTEHRMKVDVIQCLEDDPQRAVAFSKAKLSIDNIVTQCRNGTYPYKALILDNLTCLADFAMRNVLGAGGAGNPPQIQHYGMAFIQIQQVMLSLRFLPIVVVLCAHDQRDTIDKEDVREVAVQGKNLPAKITSFFDEVLYTKIIPGQGTSNQFVLQAQSSAAVTARSRGSLKDNTPQDLGLPKILELIGFDWENFKSPQGQKLVASPSPKQS